MELIAKGKTKDVYKLDNGNFLLKFKDSVTGLLSGETDPGGNIVVGSLSGVGLGALKMSVYYFELLKKHSVDSHYVACDFSKNEMEIRPAVIFGNGMEFVVRYKAAGSFIRRFGSYCKEGEKLPKIFEATIKDDKREDPPATEEIIIALKLLTKQQYDEIYCQTIKICDLIKEDLAAKGLELIDIKIEFGIVNGKIALIDEISPGNMRVYKNGNKLDYLDLSGFF